MGKKHKVFVRLLTHDLCSIFWMLIAFSIIVFLVYQMEGQETIVIMDMCLVILMGFVCCPLTQSDYLYEEFQMFHFTRKRFYRCQTILSLFRAGALALFRTLYQLLFYEDIIQYSSELYEVARESFQKPVLWETFLMNTCVFLIINQLQLISHTSVFMRSVSEILKEEVSLQFRLRRDEMSEKYSDKWKDIRSFASIITVILIFGLGVLEAIYTQIRMTCSFPIRMLVIVILMLIGGALYLIGKKRYVPEYI